MKHPIHLSLEAFLASLLLTIAVSAAPIDDAKKLLAEKKYGEAEEALKPLLAAAVPSIEALALAADVAAADGW